MKKLISLFATFSLMLSFAACGSTAPPSASVPPASSAAPVAGASAQQNAKPATDRSGASIDVPATINSIVVLAPSIAETVVALGEGEKIIGIDTYSTGIDGLSSGLPAFDMANPDAEQLAALSPDIILVSSMSIINGENPFKPLTDLGICVACVPTSNSIQDVKDDISFLAAVLNKNAEGKKMNSDLQAEIDRIAAIAGTITDKKTVYFEIAAAPEPYSFGSGVFLNEMIELIGAQNVFTEQSGWLRVEPESAIAANPDVILTNVNYLDDPVAELLGREGWGGINAISGKQVYTIDNSSSSQPNQNIVLALNQMAKAVYPEFYE